MRNGPHFPPQSGRHSSVTRKAGVQISHVAPSQEVLVEQMSLCFVGTQDTHTLAKKWSGSGTIWEQKS